MKNFQRLKITRIRERKECETQSHSWEKGNEKWNVVTIVLQNEETEKDLRKENERERERDKKVWEKRQKWKCFQRDKELVILT